MRIFLFDYTPRLEGLNITFVNNSYEFYELFLNQQYDVLIANFDFFNEVKEIINVYNGYIIFLSKICDELIYKKALEIADFCYSYDEVFKLKYRLEYLKRKIYNMQGSIFKHKELLYNCNLNRLYKKNQELDLTKAQQEVLELLIKNRNNYLNSEYIVNASPFIGSKNSIKVIISSLRKLGFDIISKQNLGYKLKE